MPLQKPFIIAKLEELTSNLTTSINDFITHLLDLTAHATKSNITYYVDDILGSDTNTGLAAGAGTALKTIQAAINKLPQIVNTVVTVNVAAGTYAETVTVYGFTGKGSITLQGGTNLTTASNYLVNRIMVRFNNIGIFINGFKANIDQANGTFTCTDNYQVVFNWCIDLRATGYGFTLYNGFYIVNLCQASNHTMAAVYGKDAIVEVIDCTGNDNYYGVRAGRGAFISRAGSAVFGKRIRGSNGDCVDDGSIIGPIVTWTDIIMYVRSDGSDDNNGNSDDAAGALLTIQEAIRRLPPRIDHAITINVAAGTYVENVIIAGFIGKGSITIQGGASLATAVNHLVNSWYVNNTGCRINIYGFKANASIADGEFKGETNKFVYFYNCISEQVSAYGFLFDKGGNYYMNNCRTSNHTSAGAIVIRSTLALFDSHGSANVYGVIAGEGSHVHYYGAGSKLGKRIRGTINNDHGYYGGAIFPMATYTDLTLYVRPDGSDDNDGSANTTGAALQTINEAIRRIPQRVDHTVTINVAAGTYNETVKFSGFTGNGTIYLYGAAATNDTHTITNLTVIQCAIQVFVRGFKALSTTAIGFVAQSSAYVNFTGCKCVGASSYAGIEGYWGGYVAVFDSELSNRGPAINSTSGVSIYSSNNTGNGNSVGLRAAYAATIGKNGTQPAGTITEQVLYGGEIR